MVIIKGTMITLVKIEGEQLQKKLAGPQTVKELIILFYVATFTFVSVQEKGFKILNSKSGFILLGIKVQALQAERL